MKDLLCGCSYCLTVETGQPLDLHIHFMNCHSTKDAMQKTLDLMNETEKPSLVNTPKEIDHNESSQQNLANIHNEYQWSKDMNGDWQFMNTQDALHIIDSWIYHEKIGWLWSFNRATFLYSENFGWLYNFYYKKNKIFYWYDRRMWILPKGLRYYDNP